jgi:hypothetical protein
VHKFQINTSNCRKINCSLKLSLFARICLGEEAQVKERRQTREEEKTFQSLKSSSVPRLDLSSSKEVGARTPRGPLKDNQGGATSAIGEQTFDATLSRPSSFPQWQTQLRQCMETQSALLPRNCQSAPAASTFCAPHGIGKQQTW